MKTLTYEITINASKETVWHTLTDRKEFAKWGEAFAEGSYFEGSWEKGAEITFLVDGRGGTVARIEELVAPEKLVALHIATVTKDGEKETTGPMTEKWIGTKETYTLSQEGNQTHLHIEVLSDPEYVKMFEEGWGKALESIKRLSEEN